MCGGWPLQLRRIGLWTIEFKDTILSWGWAVLGRIAVKTMRFSIIVIAIMTLLLTSPTFAMEFCGGAKLMCTAQAIDSDFGAAKKMSHKRDRCGCTGSGAELFACRCKCKGEPDFPCNPETGPFGERRCICQ
jgi:hypothetical protein